MAKNIRPLQMTLIPTLKSKFEQLVRLVFVNSITRKNGSIILVEYPKSGGTWLSQLISSYLEIPFPRHRIPSLKKSLYHSHYLPKYNIPKNDKIVFLVRDGRDVAISQYFHQLVWNEKNKLNPKDVNYHRSQLRFENYDKLKENLASFLHYIFKSRPSKLQQFTYMGNWYEFNQKWIEQMKKADNIYLIKYESLLDHPHQTLSELFTTFFNTEVDPQKLVNIIDQYSFETLSKRKKGEENKNSFLRKGISGDWKNYFGEKEKEIFKEYTGDLLVELGYEKDSNW